MSTPSHDHPHDHAKWKHDGVRVIPGQQLDPNTAQTPAWTGAPRSTSRAWARRSCWAGTVTIHANAKTGAHHHGHLESVIYVVKGRARMRWGEHLEFTAEAGPATSSTCRPTCRTRRSMPAPARRWSACCAAAMAEAVAINLDIEPAEKPEQVLWVDPTHPHGAV
jgi:uncharacterized RmlC-like cupin family protein